MLFSITEFTELLFKQIIRSAVRALPFSIISKANPKLFVFYVKNSSLKIPFVKIGLV